MNVLQELILFCGQIWWRFSHTVSDSLWHLSEPEGAFRGRAEQPWWPSSLSINSDQRLSIHAINRCMDFAPLFCILDLWGM